MLKQSDEARKQGDSQKTFDLLDQWKISQIETLNLQLGALRTLWAQLDGVDPPADRGDVHADVVNAVVRLASQVTDYRDALANAPDPNALLEAAQLYSMSDVDDLEATVLSGLNRLGGSQCPI